MDVRPFTGELAAADHDLLIVAVPERELDLREVRELDRSLGGGLLAAARDERFEGKERQLVVVTTLGRIRPRRVALVGVGKRASGLGEQAAVALGARVARLARDVGASAALLAAPEGLLGPAAAALVARGALLGAYTFDKYKSDRSKKRPLGTLHLHVRDRKAAAAVKGAIARAAVVADAVRVAKDLVNEPAIELSPEGFAARARRLGREYGLAVEVLGPAELRKRGMRLLLGVGAGSVTPPRLVHLAYRPRGRRKPGGARPLVLVGKGITFDSGGLSLKPAASMEEMKSDMAGGAAVLATLCAVARLRAEQEVHGVIALAENMPSGTAIRPGDVLTSAAGKSVEVVNTDAEGRLVLADALHYARGLAPRAIVDVATLTGACIVALGHHVGGLFSNDDDLAARVLSSAKASGETFWRLPLVAEQRSELRSEVADLKNTGGREGGAITAALFLSEFAGDTPWVHLDIAGLAMGKGRLEPKGATGAAVPTLVALAAP